MQMKIVALLVWMIAFNSMDAHAHGELHKLIKMLSTDIEADPKNADLYFQRGELYRMHKDWDLALSDFDKAESLNPKIADHLNLARARVHLGCNDPEKALKLLNQLASASPSAEVFTVRAEVLENLLRLDAAADDLAKALVLNKEAPAFLYLQHADLLLRAKKDNQEAALKTLNGGLCRLGSVITLESRALELEVQLKRFDAAMARLDRLIGSSPRKEQWLAHKAKVLAAAGRADESRAVYRETQQVLNALTPQQRSTPASKEIQQQIKEELTR